MDPPDTSIATTDPPACRINFENAATAVSSRFNRDASTTSTIGTSALSRMSAIIRS
ncbi:hypothetical protein QOZ89_13430 [Pseudofrankia sp. BMG5.37]|uniref:hypothetical protein n=1 Tax=Pseudofrankia sp. BMG5.36 TaxID=1834512 RepID=UPI0012FF9A62|nr:MULTISPECIES: hypothetical protein [unclassified Pseudofrankia]MDT3440588.1 hypothetical protein [Pseudofrankia sp. BMG5.37]